MWTYEPFLIGIPFIFVPSRMLTLVETGMTSSRMAVLIVPCTGGHNRSVSRITASKNGKASTASELANLDGRVGPKDEKDAVDAVSSSESVGDDSLEELE